MFYAHLYDWDMLKAGPTLTTLQRLYSTVLRVSFSLDPASQLQSAFNKKDLLGRGGEYLKLSILSFDLKHNNLKPFFSDVHAQ